jgi:large subunit ribosomal protein L29
MKRADLEKLNNEELKKRCAELKDEIFQARLKFRMGQFKKTSEFKRMRKDVAQILTFIKSKESTDAKKGAA